MEEIKSGQTANAPSQFAKAIQNMIGKNTDSYKNLNSYGRVYKSYTSKEYTPDELVDIIVHGDLIQIQQLSESYYNTNGYYQQLVNYYATLLKYQGILIPNANGKSLSGPGIEKRYNQALDYIDKMNLSIWLPHCARRALIYGTYYGLRVDLGKSDFAIIDLPTKYCKTEFKDIKGNDIIQFDVKYFSEIIDKDARDRLLALFPKSVKMAYYNFLSGKNQSLHSWVMLPTELSVCFSLFDGRPLFVKTLPAILDYHESVLLEHEKDNADIEKIIVQKVPHLQDGRLVFEPEEAEEMHFGAVGMLNSSKNIKVLTTYADVDAIESKKDDTNVDDKLTRLEQNIYSSAGVSGEIFAPTGSSSLPTALNNDLSIMMQLANQFSLYITNLLNLFFSNSNVSFKYSILPISYYNVKEVIDNSFKLVGSGYSLLMPALAQGFSQRELSNIKDLENDLLKLNDKLIPLSNAYTQSTKSNDSSNNRNTSTSPASSIDGGRPELPVDEKTDKTIKNIEAK